MEKMDMTVPNLIPPRVSWPDINKMTVEKRTTVSNSTTTISGFHFSSYFKASSSYFQTPSGYTWKEGKCPPYPLQSQLQTSKISPTSEYLISGVRSGEVK